MHQSKSFLSSYFAVDCRYSLLSHQVPEFHPNKEELMVKYGHDKATKPQKDRETPSLPRHRGLPGAVCLEPKQKLA